MEIKNLVLGEALGSFKLSEDITGNSAAVAYPQAVRNKPITVAISDVQNGTVAVEFTLDDKAAVDADTATWYPTGAEDVADQHTLISEAPYRFIRFVAAAACTYTYTILAYS